MDALEARAAIQGTSRLSADFYRMQQSNQLLPIVGDNHNLVLRDIASYGTPEQLARVESAIAKSDLIIEDEVMGTVVVKTPCDDPTEDYARHYMLQLAFPEPYIALLGKLMDDAESFKKVLTHCWSLHQVQEPDKRAKPEKKVVNSSLKKLWKSYMEICANRKLMLTQMKEYRQGVVAEHKKVLADIDARMQVDKDAMDQRMREVYAKYMANKK